MGGVTTDAASTTLATLETIRAVIRMALFVDGEEAAAVLAEMNRMETILPITDPTAFRQVSRNLTSHKASVQAFLAFRGAIERIVGDELARSGDAETRRLLDAMGVPAS